MIQAATATIRRTLGVFRAPRIVTLQIDLAGLSKDSQRGRCTNGSTGCLLTANFDSAKWKKVQEGTRLDRTRDQLRNSRNNSDFRRENGLT